MWIWKLVELECNWWCEKYCNKKYRRMWGKNKEFSGQLGFVLMVKSILFETFWTLFIDLDAIALIKLNWLKVWIYQKFV